ncbi:hypothetical protein MPLSOD_10359 [Mesorhizobium sp. SOD10]|nr:hypothetical protein MPLSOD_10359 [Mesorhizobium sp. SOD10]
MAVRNSLADIVSSGLLSEREMEPVVNLLVLPQPATLAANAAMKAVVMRRLAVRFKAVVGICGPVSIPVRPLAGRLPSRRNILLTLTDR